MTDLEEFEKIHPDSLQGEGIVTEHGVIMTSMEFRCRICRKIDTLKTTVKSVKKAAMTMSDPYTNFVRKKGGILKSLVIPENGKKTDVLAYICPGCINKLGLIEANEMFVHVFECFNCNKSIEIEVPIKSIGFIYDEYSIVSIIAKERGWRVSFAVRDNDVVVKSFCPECIISD